MPQGDKRCLPVAQRGTEGDAEILFGESTIPGQNQPKHQSDKLACHEANRYGKNPDECDKRQRQQIKETFHEKKRSQYT